MRIACHTNAQRAAHTQNVWHTQARSCIHSFLLVEPKQFFDQQEHIVYKFVRIKTGPWAPNSNGSDPGEKIFLTPKRAYSGTAGAGKNFFDQKEKIFLTPDFRYKRSPRALEVTILFVGHQKNFFWPERTNFFDLKEKIFLT